MTRIVVAVASAAAAILLSATAVHAQETDTDTAKNSIKPALVFTGAWVTAASIDVWSDRYAVANARAIEGNPIMPGDQQTRYAVTYAAAAAGAWAVTRLWQHDHKRLAVALTVGNLAFRAFVAQHNIAIGNGGRPGS
jgi:hypothetical protein